MLLCCQVLTSKRAEIIAAIREVQGAVAEDAWLEDYENDEGRYKVCEGAGCCSAHSCLLVLHAMPVT
jgi:glutathionyl-hydroquinone reductase